MTEENYDRGGGRSGSSERLGYASTDVRGLLASLRARSTTDCPGARYSVPQPAIEIQLNWQPLLCCIGDCEEDFPQSESPDECSMGSSVADAAAATEA